MTINILGVNTSTDSKQEILKKVSYFLSGNKQRYIVTPNPEFLLAAAKDEEFYYILNKADIAIPDGAGLTLAGLLMGRLVERISGVDLMRDICKIAEQENKSVFLLGGTEGVAREAEQKLKKLYPNLRIAGAETGLEAGEWAIERGQWVKGEARSKKLEARVNEVQPDIIFVAFGHIKQEKWMFHSLPHLPSVKIAMGVGGSFDFIAGRIKRAPKIMRIIGLEWLWRLLQEPKKRMPRIYDAVVKFPVKFIQWRFINPYFYRPNVACLLYKRDEQGKIKVLLAERRNEANHWQLPQGGTDREDLETAGSRELREEIGTDKFKPEAFFKNVYRYKFGDGLGRSEVRASLLSGYKGQKQGLFIAQFLGKDSDITINYWDHRSWKWADLEKAADEVWKLRQEATKIFIDKFKISCHFEERNEVKRREI